MTTTDTNINMTSDDLNNLQSGNEKTLEDIKNLQQYEKELYDNLEQNSFNGKLTAEEKQSIINKINQISQMRINLYDNLKNMYGFLQQNASNTRNTLDEQMIAVQIVENELNNSKRKLKALEEEKNNKIRLVEINNYFGKQYSSHSKTMKIIVFTCIPIILLTIMYNNGLLPDILYNILTGLIIVAGIIFLGRNLVDIWNRDNMNYDEYDWAFYQENAPLQNASIAPVDSSNSPWSMPTMTCIGSGCCYEGTTYDETKNMCIPGSVTNPSSTGSTDATTTSTTATPTTQTNVTESMVGNIFSKYSYNNNTQKTKQLSTSGVKPFTDNYTQFATF